MFLSRNCCPCTRSTAFTAFQTISASEPSMVPRPGSSKRKAYLFYVLGDLKVCRGTKPPNLHHWVQPEWATGCLAGRVSPGLSQGAAIRTLLPPQTQTPNPKP